MKSKEWSADTNAVESINNMLKIHDAQLCAITKSEFSNAIQEVIRQLDSGNFSKPNDLVLAKQYNYDVTNSSKSHIH
jgi:hypothetical protein